MQWRQCPVRIERIPASQRLAVVRRRAGVRELSKVVPEACGIVWAVLRAQRISGAGRHVAVYLDDQINLEVGVELNLPFAGHGEVVASALPAGMVATATHFGPYPNLCKTHQAIRDWCAKHGHLLAGPNWEIYDHWTEEWNRDASKIRTDIFYLLKAAGDSAS